MTPLVPQKTTAALPSRLLNELSDLLLSALEVVGATAGWIGLQEANGLSFPVRLGVPPLPPQLWGGEGGELPWQQAPGSVWGFTSNDETAVLNDLHIGSKRGDPPLRNLLTCPLIHNKQILGHLALANKAHNFTNEDALVLGGLAHHMVRLLGRMRTPKPTPTDLSAWRRILDRAAEGVLVLDPSGVLIYANAAWLNWTGFRAEELIGRSAPFPFWVSQCQLMQALRLAPAAPAAALPFRRRDQSLLWCRVETAEEQWGGQQLTIAFLRQTSVWAGEPAASAAGLSASHPAANAAGSPSLDWPPLLLDLDHGVEGWEARWEARTGLSMTDVKDSRCELVLDWLFPQQNDRNRVADCFHPPRPAGCQLILEVAASDGSRPMRCTFLPLSPPTATAAPRRWLLLVGEVERGAESAAVERERLFDRLSVSDASTKRR